MNWKGHPFAFLLRVDVEHVEAQKYTGDSRMTKVAVTNLLDLFAEIGTRHSFALLGITAEFYPNLAKDIATDHGIFGHGMYHEPALSGRSLQDLRHEMRRMKDAIANACGVDIRGIAVPHHGMADENTLRAAAEIGLEYINSRIQAENSDLPRFHQIEGTDMKILVSGDRRRGASDYSARRRTWAEIHEEAFCPDVATRKWQAMIDWAKDNGRMCTLVVHPWMTMINAGEIKVIKDVITYARDQGAWMGTFDQLADLALAQEGAA